MDRLTIDITDQQHQSLKAWRELRILLGERIAEGLAGSVSARSFDAIVEEELGQDNRA